MLDQIRPHGLDMFRDVIGGDRQRRIHALLAFGLWFAAGAFLASTAQYYLLPMESTLTSVVGGISAAILAAIIKLS